MNSQFQTDLHFIGLPSPFLYVEEWYYFLFPPQNIFVNAPIISHQEIGVKIFFLFHLAPVKVDKLIAPKIDQD